jgi:hypothetical protein
MKRRQLWWCEECQRWERPSFGLLVGTYEVKTGAVYSITNPKDDIDKWTSIPNNFMWARETTAFVCAVFDWLMWRFARKETK